MNRRTFLRAVVSGIAAVGLKYGGAPAPPDLSDERLDRLFNGIWVPEEIEWPDEIRWTWVIDMGGCVTTEEV